MGVFLVLLCPAPHLMSVCCLTLCMTFECQVKDVLFSWMKGEIIISHTQCVPITVVLLLLSYHTVLPYALCTVLCCPLPFCSIFYCIMQYQLVFVMCVCVCVCVCVCMCVCDFRSQRRLGFIAGDFCVVVPYVFNY